MFAPVASRFHSYQIKLPNLSRQYVSRVLSDPPMQDWYAAAAAETAVIKNSEIQD
jgi:glutathione S-transferase